LGLTIGTTGSLTEATRVDIFKNPDDVIQEVEDNEARRERETDVKQDLDESPEDHDEDGKD